MLGLKFILNYLAGEKFIYLFSFEVDDNVKH